MDCEWCAVLRPAPTSSKKNVCPFFVKPVYGYLNPRHVTVISVIFEPQHEVSVYLSLGFIMLLLKFSTFGIIVSDFQYWLTSNVVVVETYRCLCRNSAFMWHPYAISNKCSQRNRLHKITFVIYYSGFLRECVLMETIFFSFITTQKWENITINYFQNNMESDFMGAKFAYFIFYKNIYLFICLKDIPQKLRTCSVGKNILQGCNTFFTIKRIWQEILKCHLSQQSIRTKI